MNGAATIWMDAKKAEHQKKSHPEKYAGSYLIDETAFETADLKKGFNLKRKCIITTLYFSEIGYFEFNLRVHMHTIDQVNRNNHEEFSPRCNLAYLHTCTYLSIP